MPRFVHDFPFDPSYGRTLGELLRIAAPAAPVGFDSFWRARYEVARRVEPEPRVGALVEERDGVRILDVSYTSTGGRCGGWLVLPADGAPVRHGFVIGHGYGGRDQAGPDVPLPLPASAAILPCVSGMPDKGLRPGVPSVADEHVVHGIDSRDGYIIGDCVADLWCAASALIELVPALSGRGLGYLGESFGGGLGALALPWDERFAAAQLRLPTFGHHPLRLTLPCVGSGEAVRRHHRDHPGVLDVLAYYDAATAATRTTAPVLVAPALRDPAVPPPGQFAVYNALSGPRQLHVLQAGHVPYDGAESEARALRAATAEFFATHLA
ncbi:acetylxylan esterase [Streptomyces sparsogenes]|uniref:Putative acetyl esterase n=1 Tax=Streptomyces sparsogenes DSM 40356 TaxID=1331668 RepID=A0A1R1SA68_9ACTN|nr:acetylxylan esterase [Streptomyces sparsogenes]OMI35206.1 putative acetyl esterase [Streptomyces sparsogenes DSM 40356]